VAVDFLRPVEALIPGAQGRILAVLAETSAESTNSIQRAGTSRREKALVWSGLRVSS
jgi:hypothetical protein